MNNIEQNLYAFYECVGTTNDVQHIHEEGYHVVLSDKNFWLELLFNIDQNIDPEIFIRQIASDINVKNYPPYFIAPDSYIGRKQAVALKENGIVPLKILRGMNLILGESKEVPLPDGILVKEIVDFEFLTDFADIVNEDLTASSKVLDVDFLMQIKDLNQITLFGLFHKEKLVSTAMVCTEKQCGGLYFIATKKESRKKGYATILIEATKNIFYENGIKELVLHGNNTAIELYRKLGFVHQNNFVIYKKL